MQFISIVATLNLRMAPALAMNFNKLNESHSNTAQMASGLP